jgi:YVTN family beta-propeller protein
MDLHITMNQKISRWSAVLLGVVACVAARGADKDYLSPTALAPTSDGKTIYVGYATANQVGVFDVASGKVSKTIAVPDAPLGLALSKDNARLFVTCAAAESTLCVINTAKAKVEQKITLGHTAMAPVLAPNGKTLYVCNRFQDNVAEIDLESGKVVRTIKVAREPVGADITPDGKYLLVANHLHVGRGDADVVAASVSIIDTAAGKVIKEIALPNGSVLLRELRISPDGKYACVTHLLARFHLPTTQLERGWTESNAISLIDLAKLELINTMLLDNVDSGAANPWACGWSADGKTLCATHAGTHEVSVIDVPGVFAKLGVLAGAKNGNVPAGYIGASRSLADVPNDLAFLVEIRKRIKLPGNGPRALAIIGSKVYVAHYFTDNLTVVDFSSQYPAPKSIELGSQKAVSKARRGEMLFNDATICFQGWLSCASCHSSDARVDGLNWDLLNDGIGNPKNAKSLLFSFQTPPTTSMAVRENAYISVRSGIRHILFTVQPEEVADALDNYLLSLKPMASPHLVKGKLTPAAERGKKIYNDKAVACATCHPAGMFTDMKAYDVGTPGKFDKVGDKYDTPTLIETWRTGPYLHDGSAATMRELFTTRNAKDQHGKTSHLTAEQIDDLVAYVLSL